MLQQVTRLAVVFGALIAALVFARYSLTPETFGEIGHYRAASIDAVASHDIKYAGRAACAGCHDDVIETHDASRHKGVACEVCHGPAIAHVEDPLETHPSAPRERGYCPLCHGYDPSRPTGFPQIDPVTHNPLSPCISCHEPHAPEPPVTPESCAACHGQIARTKAVSHHALLECTRCHETQEEHRNSPLLSRPTKPSSREFCGQCHAPDATGAEDLGREVPRVDLSEHYARYVCWQCHYPHYPELE